MQDFEKGEKMSIKGSLDHVLIVAELSANHGFDIEIAKQSIKAAKEAGADAAKLQTYTADTLTINCDNEHFMLNSGTIWDGITLYQLYQQAYTPWEWHEELFKYAKEVDITLFSTPFDKTAVDFLEKLGVPFYKVASFEIVDLPLIRYIASTQKTIILSTGIATLEEIDDAINVCKQMGNDRITLLKCTSTYPAQIKDSNLLDIKLLKKRYNVPVGLSDHTIGCVAAQVAVGLGATVFEKHFILDKSIGGPDASFSADKHEFSEYVESIRNAVSCLGEAGTDFRDANKSGRRFARSLFAVKDIKKGETFTSENIRSIRPGVGLAPKYYDAVVGKTAKADIKRGTPIQSAFFE